MPATSHVGPRCNLLSGRYMARRPLEGSSSTAVDVCQGEGGRTNIAEIAAYGTPKMQLVKRLNGRRRSLILCPWTPGGVGPRDSRSGRRQNKHKHRKHHHKVLRAHMSCWASQTSCRNAWMMRVFRPSHSTATCRWPGGDVTKDNRNFQTANSFLKHADHPAGHFVPNLFD